MAKKDIPIHEKLEIHEILNFKTICLAKHKMMLSLVTNKELKTFMLKETEQYLESVSNLQSLLTEGPIQ